VNQTLKQTVLALTHKSNMRLPLDYDETKTWVDNRHSRFVEPLPNLNPHRTAIFIPNTFFHRNALQILQRSSPEIFATKPITFNGLHHQFP
jgi:hypothetical protein